jgi:predicted RNA-binding Zn ribbon-like protein
MGMITDAQIAAWQKAAGIQPATGRCAELLREMSDAAFELIKVIELHRSGICHGDGSWHVCMDRPRVASRK